MVTGFLVRAHKALPDRGLDRGKSPNRAWRLAATQHQHLTSEPKMRRCGAGMTGLIRELLQYEEPLQVSLLASGHESNSKRARGGGKLSLPQAFSDASRRHGGLPSLRVFRVGKGKQLHHAVFPAAPRRPSSPAHRSGQVRCDRLGRFDDLRG